MILFLTYHRVCTDATPDSERDFYTVARSTFARHMRELIAAGLAPMNPRTLCATADPATPRCYLSFDDATQDHHETVLPVLQQLDLRAVFFVPTAKLDQPDRKSVV